MRSPPRTVRPKPHELPKPTVVRFTRRIARQCASPVRGAPDWAVCDAVANGTQRRLPGPGLHVVFERLHPGKGGPSVRLRILGRIRGSECLALRLLPPGGAPEKIWDTLGFLNRAGSK